MEKCVCVGGEQPTLTLLLDKLFILSSYQMLQSG